MNGPRKKPKKQPTGRIAKPIAFSCDPKHERMLEAMLESSPSGNRSKILRYCIEVGYAAHNRQIFKARRKAQHEEPKQ